MKITSFAASVASALAFMAAITPSSPALLVQAAAASSMGSGSGSWNDLVVPLDVPTNATEGPHDHFHGPAKGKAGGGFGVRSLGGRLQLCPTGDCSQSIVDITMHHLHEVDGKGKPTKNRVQVFGVMPYNWSAPVTAPDTHGVNVTTSAFSASLPVNGSNTLASFNASVAFYATNSTQDYAGTIISIPAGGLKFAVWIDNWPFLGDDHQLLLGLRVMAHNKTSGRKPIGRHDHGQGRDKKIDRTTLQNSMFLDSPSVAVIDGSPQNVMTKAKPGGDFVIMEYAFPKFTQLYYDPVVSADASSTDAGSSAGSKSGNVRASAASSSASSMTAVVVMSSLAIVLMSAA
ncbi:TPA: hypothetical protein N0F65_010693 [Lagenidium giganteum]|uniref:Uncharacterized protein n=1 Tax=Lagenidium giganteum TaxID=4803 RepID=A0AAV2ZDU4_9STRA|nr:TPA: hypothetical protein N0F65_010693 [Lagenidium giganteum]